MKRHPFAPLIDYGLLAALAACASTSGAAPHDMSVAAHEAEAYREQRAAGAGADDPTGRAAPRWISERTPTAEHREEAERHRKMAADHRAAAQALRDAEARACAGIPEQDRDISPFFHGQDLERVEPLIQEIRFQGGTGSSEETVGAVVYFRPVSGLTQELLQRIVNCHLARNAAMGHAAPEMAYCPLVPDGVDARVRSDGDRFAVEIRGRDADAAREVLRRARLLVKR